MSRERMICQTCYKHEPKRLCAECGEQRKFVTEATGGVCPDCIKRAARSAKAQCAGCERTERLAKLGGQYCKPCQKKANRQYGKCSSCGKDGRYAVKKEKLCFHCYMNRCAPRRLQKLFKTVRLPNEYNQTLFDHLAGSIDCEKADEETCRQVLKFISFLKIYRFDSPLTWESIIKLKSNLPGVRFHYVRRCLQLLGELLLDPLKDETLEECKKRIKPLGPVASLEANAIAVFERYDLWLRSERQDVPRTRWDHFLELAGFWKWCVMRGLTSLAMVENEHVEEFLYTLGLKWRCRHCDSTKNVTRRGESQPAICENLNCKALRSYEKVVRRKPYTVRKCRSTLRLFFSWLKDVDEGIQIHPLPRCRRRKWNDKKRGLRKKKYLETMRYYDWEVIDALLTAIEDPKMPAEEAMALYLLLYHAFYLWELRTVRIPPQCRPTAAGVKSHELLEDVLSLEWLPRRLSRGKQFLGRTSDILKMEPADEPWLRDLVRRFMIDREKKQQRPDNPYLFVGTRRIPRSGPVDEGYLRTLIASATARVTGRVCRVDILGKSSRVLYSEFGGYEGFRHLRELGLSEETARSFTWAKRVRVVPRKASRILSTRFRGLSVAEIPATDIFGNPTDV
jgi:hypothetical protein